MVELFAVHMEVGTACWMEHPQPCGRRLQAVSSFSWHPLRALESSPAVTTADFDQCEHGQSSRAPT
eukprot:609025-Pyramimonas_sp.AAC.1